MSKPAFWMNRPGDATCIIAHTCPANIALSRESKYPYIEITEEEAFALVRDFGHLPETELWGICLEGFEDLNRRQGKSWPIVVKP